jgi:hypothetical protein
MTAVGTFRTCRNVRLESVMRFKADIVTIFPHRSLVSFRRPQ